MSGLQASALLGLRRLSVHGLVMGCCALTHCLQAVCPSCPPSFPPSRAPGAQRSRAGSPSRLCPAVPPGWHQGCLLWCLGAGSRAGRVPSLCAWPGTLHFIISSFLLLAALTRRRARADGTCPEMSCGNTHGDLCTDNSSALQRCTRSL